MPRHLLADVSHCLEKGGDHARSDHITLLLDCAEICQTAGNFMLRKSELHAQICTACAEVCERCAEDCERFGSEDQMMKECAQSCRRCAEACRTMS